MQQCPLHETVFLTPEPNGVGEGVYGIGRVLCRRRRERLDTIRARITKFGPEVVLEERCSHTKFDVTVYFRSPGSGHFVNYLSNFSVQYLRDDWIYMHQIWKGDRA